MGSDDGAAIDSVVRDYFEGWFEGDAGRMERALLPELAKRGLEGGQLVSATAREMIDATARGVGKERARSVPDPWFEIEIEDVYGAVASVTVRSAIYHEYVHLARTNGGWKIVNTLWQRTRPDSEGRR